MLGIPLCIIVGMPILGFIFGFLGQKLGFYNQTFVSIFWIISNLLTASAFILIGKRVKFSNIAPNISAYVAGAIYLLYLVSHITYLSVGTYLMVEADESLRVGVPILCVIAVGLIFGYSNASLPVKVSVIISFIPSIFVSIISNQLQNAYENYQATNDYEPYGQLINTLETIGYIESALFVIALILTIVWLSKRPMAHSKTYQNNDII